MKKQVKTKTQTKGKAAAKPLIKRGSTEPSLGGAAPTSKTRGSGVKVGRDAHVAANPRASTHLPIIVAKGSIVHGKGRKTAQPIEVTSPSGKTPAKAEKQSRAERTPESPPSATSLDPIQFIEEAPRKVKTYLTPAQLQEFRELLLAKRAELAGDVQRLTAEARKENGFNEQSTMPIHMADLGSDNWEQDFTLGLIVNEQNLVREIDHALARIADKTYGMCLATQARITIARLRAKPWAKHCIEYERAREEGRAP